VTVNMTGCLCDGIVHSNRLGFVAVSFLAAEDGRAPDSANCNVVGNSNVDLIVAIVTSVLGYLLILPILYLFAQILVPSFEVDF